MLLYLKKNMSFGDTLTSINNIHVGVHIFNW